MIHPRPAPKTIFFRLAILLFWSGIILWLSLSPSPPSRPPSFLAWDKLQHAAGYALLTYFAGRVLLLFARSIYRGWLLAMAAAFLFGALIEIAQDTMTSVRHADPADLLANFCGAAAVAVTAVVFRACRKVSGRVGQ